MNVKLVEHHILKKPSWNNYYYSSMLINIIYTAVKQQAGELLSLHSFKPFLITQMMQKDSKPQY